MVTPLASPSSLLGRFYGCHSGTHAVQLRKTPFSEATNAICIVDHLHARLRHASVGSLECANLPLELFQWFTQFPLPGVVHTLSVPGTYTFRTDHVLLHRFVLCFGSLRSAAFVADTFSKTLISGDFLRECASHEIMSVELDVRCDQC